MKNFYLLTKDSNEASNLSVPLLWCTLKTYYEENGKHPTEWQWSDPYLGRKSTEEILSAMRQTPPDVVGFNVYVWNESVQDELAQQVKAEFPNCFIIYGGPQQTVKYNLNYFREKPWVDIVLPNDTYGEIILQEILDSFPITDYTPLPYIYYTDSERNRYMTEGSIAKREFVWPKNIFRAQEKYILPLLQEYRQQNRITVAYYHTSRGCPYKCIYCSWGGGLNIKPVKKPYTTILDELEWLAEKAQVNRIEFSDANFGIMSIDIEIARHCVALNEQYNFPQTVEVEPAKNNLSRIIKIEELLMSRGLMSHHRISIQSLNAEVRHNIERINMPFEEQVKALRYLQSQPGGDLPIYIEAIVGLPGDNYASVCEQIDLVHSLGVDIGLIHHYGWMLLPESPGYAPEMRERFKIKTVKKWVNQNPKLKEGFAVANGDALALVGDIPTKHVETVVATHSYSAEEWIHMFRISNFSIAGHILGINHYLIEYLCRHHSATPSRILDLILGYMDQGLSAPVLDQYLQQELDTITAWVFGDVASDIDFAPEFPFMMPHHAYFAFVILLRIRDFYSEIGARLAEEFDDSAVEDLCYYLQNAVLDIDYTGLRQWSCTHDWQQYFVTGELLTEHTEYIVDDAVDIVSTDPTQRLIDFYTITVSEGLDPKPRMSRTLRRYD